jgi:hypothetical protein
LAARIANLRDRFNGRIQREGDDPRQLGAELDRLLAEQKSLADRVPSASATLDACRSWLATLPPTAELEPVEVDIEGQLLPTVRARINQLQSEVATLKQAPTPAADIEQRIGAYVQKLAQPTIRGIGAGETLTVTWPDTLPALLAAVVPGPMGESLMAQVQRTASDLP